MIKCRRCYHPLKAHILVPDHDEMVSTLECIAFSSSVIGGFCPCNNIKYIVIEGVEL